MSDEGRLVAGRYRLAERIGRGGMGTVWRAQDEVLGRQIALKQLHEPPNLTADELATLYERTRREARSAARVVHPNVVVVHDVVEDEGRPCIVMEYVPALTLDELLKDGRTLPPDEAARIGLGMIAALRAAHAAGVLHRDVKPGNVLLGAEGRTVLTDFGIATTTGTSTLTRTGEMVGSIDFMAPERIRGQKPGPASDLWSLGATLYQAVEGRPPFRRDTAVETAYAIAVDPFPPMQRAGALEPLIQALLFKEPGERPSAEQTERALRAARSGAATEAMPRASAPGTTAVEPLATRAAGAPAGLLDAGAPGRSSGAAAVRAPGSERERAYDSGEGRAYGRGSEASYDRGAERTYDRGPEASYDRGAERTYDRGPEASYDRGAERTYDRGPEAAYGPGAETASGTARPGSREGRRGRRKGVLLVAAAVAVASVAAATLYVTSQPDKARPPEARGPAARTSAPTDTPPPPLPQGYHRVKDERLGVSFPVPDGWTARGRTADEVTYADPSGLVGITIGMVSPAGANPQAHFLDIERNTKANYPTYRRLRMQQTTFRGQPAAIWEFTFQGRVRTYRAINLGYGREGGREYDIYLSAPNAQWNTHRPVFDHVRDGFTPTGS